MRGSEPPSCVVDPTPAEAKGVNTTGIFNRKCFLASMGYVAQHLDLNPRLVHGRVHRTYAHAWVILPGGKVFDGSFHAFFAKDAYDEEMHTEVERSYSYDEAIPLLKLYRFFGPWHLTSGWLPSRVVAEDIWQACDCCGTRDFYRRIARRMPLSDVYQAIFDAREHGATHPAASFLNAIRTKATERGITIDAA